MTAILDQLWATIQSRKTTLPEGSYTTFLFGKGENEILKKVGEEAIEVIVATRESDDRVIYEAADLIYHLMVLLAARGLTWQQVESELGARLK